MISFIIDYYPTYHRNYTRRIKKYWWKFTAYSSTLQVNCTISKHTVYILSYKTAGRYGLFYKCCNYSYCICIGTSHVLVSKRRVSLLARAWEWLNSLNWTYLCTKMNIITFYLLPCFGLQSNDEVWILLINKEGLRSSQNPCQLGLDIKALKSNLFINFASWNHTRI